MDITQPVTRHLTRAKFQVPVYRLAIQNGMSIIARACKVYQSVPDYECGCEKNGDGQSHFVINFSPAIWQGDSDILISFEGCNLFREKKFLVWWNLRGETIPSYVKCNISITLIQLWNKAKVINCNLRFRAVFDWISKNQNQSNTKANPKKRKYH